MSDISKREILRRVESMEANQSRQEAAHENQLGALRRDIEGMATTLVRVETKMELLSASRKEERDAHSNRWGEIIRTGTSIITAVGLIIGGILYLVRSTTAQVDLHQQAQPQIVYVQPAPAMPAPSPTPH